MNRGGHESAAWAQVIDAPPYLLAHLIRSPVGEDALRVDQATPEGDIGAKIALERSRLHAHRADLHGIDDVDSDFDHVRDDFTDRAATVKENLGIRAGLDEVHDLLVARLDDLAIGFRVDQ